MFDFAASAVATNTSVLMEFFTELMTVIRGVPTYPVHDEFLRGMKELDQLHTVPLSLVFAAQIFLDIHHTMRSATSRCFSIMMKETSVMDNSINAHLEFHENIKIEHWPAANDRALRELSQLMKWVGRDPVYQVKKKQYHKQGMPIPPTMEPHRILMYSPILSGLLLFKFRADVYDIGIAVANAWGSIAYAAHLYNALVTAKLLKSSWPDMDIALTLLGDSSVWVGGNRSQTAEDHFKKFCLQMGVLATAFANPTKRRPNAAIASRAGPRGIKDGILYLPCLRSDL